MGIPGLIFLLVALVLIGVGIAIGLVACAVATGIIALGIVSSSFLVGLRSGRPAAGIRAFLLQCGILAGIPAGAVCAWLGVHFSSALKEQWDHWSVLAWGALGGAVAGVIVALCLDFISRQLHVWITVRMSTTRPSSLTSREP